MGYSCPVCDDPQADDEHLANHLAVTAMMRGGDHEAWLDERVPDWEGMGPTELATEVVERAEETEYPQVFEDTTDGHDHQSVESHDQGARADLPPGADALVDADHDVDAEKILEEAREMTEQRRSGDEES